MNVIQSNQIDTQDAGEVIKGGRVIVAPFDTVYGFLCDPRNEKAILKIFDLKKRPTLKTIGLAVSDISELKKIAELSEKQEEFITDKTPGRYTFIVKAKKDAGLPGYCLQNGTIGVRIPDSELILGLIKEAGGVIAQTSANVSGMPNCYSINDLNNQYDPIELEKVDLIIDSGKIEDSGASEIIDLTGTEPKIIERSA